MFNDVLSVRTLQNEMQGRQKLLSPHFSPQNISKICWCLSTMNRACSSELLHFFTPIVTLSYHKIFDDRRIPMRAGSFLLWNQLLVHGSCANSSSNFRMAQFITGFRAGEMSPQRSWARAIAVQRHCAGLPLLPLAPHVFGEVKESKQPLATERQG